MEAKLEPTQGKFEKPQLRKLEKKETEQPQKGEKSETPKKKVVKKKKDDYELPEIPDYERPELEKYEKSEFAPTERPAKHQEVTEGAKAQAGVASVAPAEEKLKNGLPKKEKPQEETPEQRKLQMGKGKIPEKKDDKEEVKLKGIPEKQVLGIVQLLRSVPLVTIDGISAGLNIIISQEQAYLITGIQTVILQIVWNMFFLDLPQYFE